MQVMTLSGGRLVNTQVVANLASNNDVSGILSGIHGGTGRNNGNFTLEIPASGTAILGSGLAANQVPFFSNVNTLTSLAGFEFVSSQQLRIPGFIRLPDMAAPTSPSNGFNVLFFNGSSILSTKNTSGTTRALVRSISNGSSGRITFWTNSDDVSADDNLYWDNTNKRFGVGTTSPDLHVDIESSAASYTGVELTNTFSTTQRWAFGVVGSGTTFGPAKGWILRDITRGANPISVSMSGWVGVNNDSPNATLDVNRGTGPFGTARFGGTTNASHFNFSTAEDTYIRGGKSTSHIFIADVGSKQVVIGSSSTPTRTLNIDLAGSNAYIAWNSAGTEKWLWGLETSVSNRFAMFNSALSNYPIVVLANGRIGTNNTTSPLTDFHIGGDVRANSLGLGMTSTGLLLQLVTDSAGKPGTTLWTVTSDARTKKNIRPYMRGIEFIRQFRPVIFQYNGENGTPNNGKEYVGFIAQDVQRVAPWMVESYPGKIGDKDTNVLQTNPNELLHALMNAAVDFDERLKRLENV